MVFVGFGYMNENNQAALKIDERPKRKLMASVKTI